MLITLFNNLVLKVNKLECMPDHIHIFLSVTPKYSPTQIVSRLKSISARKLFTRYPKLKNKKFWNSGFWSKGYYIEIFGSTTKENIRKYIQRQKEKG